MYLEHVNLSVANIERSIAFYRQVLGFRVRWRGVNSDGRAAAHVGDEHCYLALFEGESQASAPVIDYAKPGFNHLAFVVEDLDHSKSRLNRTGIEPHFETEYAPGRRLYFFDPDGIEVELVMYTSAAEAISVPGEAS